MTKVLHIHSGNLWGGVETFLVTLARSRRLAPAMEMSAALCFDDRIAAELRREAVPTCILGGARIRRPDSVWRARRVLAQRLRDERVDVAVCHQAWPLALFGSVVKEAGVPLVSWIHMPHAGRHWIDRLAQRNAPDLIICNSRYTASRLPATNTRVEIVYCPVSGPTDTAVPRTAIRQQLRTPVDDVVITQVSRMEGWKGQTVCLEALGHLRDEPGWTCWQVGGAQRPSEQRYLDSLRIAAEQCGIADRLRFTGERADVPDVLTATDVLCQPNLVGEGFGISFVEALAHGVPVVTSAIGAALEVVDDTCGVVVPAGDAGALAAALRRLIRDRGLRARLRQNGPQRARALCDPATQMRRIEALMALA